MVHRPFEGMLKFGPEVLENGLRRVNGPFWSEFKRPEC